MSSTFVKSIKYALFDLYDLFSFFVFVLGLVLVVRFFVFNPFTVVWASMEPSFQQWDFIIVDKITPRFWELERWDIIVFVPSNQEVAYIKRIIGMPWETVVIRNNKIEICPWLYDKIIDVVWCEVLEEEYIPEDFKTTVFGQKEAIFPVNEEGFFVSGDNREHSSDSRSCFGNQCYQWAPYLVTKDDLIWKVSVRLYPSVSSF